MGGLRELAGRTQPKPLAMKSRTRRLPLLSLGQAIRWVALAGSFLAFVLCSISARADDAVSADFTVSTLDLSGSSEAGSGEFTINTLLNNPGGRGVISGEFTVDSRGVDAPRSMAQSEPGTFTVDTRRFPNALPLTIHGTVVDFVGSPVRGAAVRISQIGLEPVLTMTDGLGRFSATGLTPSAYRLEATAQF
jgi:Carboxypeptidase regulatory-like domain